MPQAPDKPDQNNFYEPLARLKLACIVVVIPSPLWGCGIQGLTNMKYTLSIAVEFDLCGLVAGMYEAEADSKTPKAVTITLWPDIPFYGPVDGGKKDVHVLVAGGVSVHRVLRQPCTHHGCKGDMFWEKSCGAMVCGDCDTHAGLARCFCGWSESGADGCRELVEMGECIDEADY